VQIHAAELNRAERSRDKTPWEAIAKALIRQRLYETPGDWHVTLENNGTYTVNSSNGTTIAIGLSKNAAELLTQLPAQVLAELDHKRE
jgi:hypothetical protein